MAHAFSGTCCVDVDDPEVAAQWAEGAGLGADYFERLAEAPDAVVILSPKAGRFKLLFECRDPFPTWVPVHGLEFRCGTRTGATAQDVLPPSPHPAGGSYRWAGAGSWRDLPLLPGAIRSRLPQLGAPVHQDGAETPEGWPDPLGLTRPDAVKILAKIDPDVTYPDWIRVGQALHHEFGDDGFALWMTWSSGGSKYPGPDALQEKWAGFGRSARAVTMRSVIRDWASAADPDEFDVVEDPREAEMADLGLIPMGQFRHGGGLKWFIRDVLPQAGLAVIYGPPGAGKSFFAIDLCGAIARAAPWCTKKVRKGRVVYIAAEGREGLRKRADAYMLANGLTDDDVADFLFYPEAVNLITDEWKPFAKMVEAEGGCDLLVVDTLAQSMAGGDENASQDMGRTIAACRRLHEELGCMVLLIHHSGKDAARGARGWSGLRGAVDAEIEVTADPESKSHMARISKQKDGETGLEFPFKLHVVQLAPDEDGPRDSCVVRHLTPAEAAEAARSRPRHNMFEAVLLEVLDTALELHGGEWVKVETVLALAKDRIAYDPEKDDRRAKLVQALRSLQDHGIIELSVGGNSIRRVQRGQ